jgi:serine/threonine protein kinase
MGPDGEGEDRTATGGRGTAVGTAVGSAASPFAAAGLLPGTRVAHYVLQHELGRGGMGQVFLARDTKLDRQVAIKFVIVPGKAAVARFMAEARVTARCMHPNIVVIHEIDEHQGMPYTVLEYVQGESVSARLRGGPLPPARVAAIMTQVARAIAAAHARGIIHRDLKPANILLGADGTVKVVDFGIAKFVAHPELEGDGSSSPDDEGHKDLTAADELVGTLHYLAPEQVRRDTVDARVDLWGFGVTMFQMLAGQRPFHGLSRGEVIERLKDLDDPMRRLQDVAPNVPTALAEIVDRCLMKRADQRMPSAAELVAALEALPPQSGAQPVADGESTERMRARATVDAAMPPTRRHAVPRRRRRAIGAVIALAVIALALFVTWRARRPAREDGGGGAASPAAVSRVDALFAEIDRLERLGNTAEATRMYQAFLDEEREPGAVALAWLHKGDRQRDRGEREAALDTYAGAYARAGDRELQRRALLALGELYREEWAWDRLAAAIDVLDRLPGPHTPRGEALRQQLRVATRDPQARSGATAISGPARELLAGRRADLAASSMMTADVDGDERPEVLSIEGGELITRSGDARRIIARRAAPGLTELRCAGRDAAGAWAVAAPSLRSPTWHILDLAGGAPPASLDGLVQGPRGHCMWADLDGDRRNELYLVVDHGLARVTQVAPPGQALSLASPWQVQLVRLGSQVGDVLGGDLDGDGRGELVVALGEWRAYDVRVMRSAPDGTLRTDDRLRLGVISHLTSLGRDASGRALIAALKEDVYPSIRHLPADRPTGARAGMYVMTLGRDGLEIVRRIDLPARPGAGAVFRDLWSADLDGDGHRDVVTSVGRSNDLREGDMVVLRGRPDGDFETSVVGRVTPVGLVDSDADPASEMMVYLDGAPLPWVLGDGDQPVPRVDVVLVPEQAPPPSVRRDAGIADAWRRAEELARIGRIEAAVSALRRIAALAGDPSVRGDALRRAGTLLQARGLPAAEVFESLAHLAPEDSRPRGCRFIPAPYVYSGR